MMGATPMVGATPSYTPGATPAYTPGMAGMETPTPSQLPKVHSWCLLVLALMSE